MWLQTGSETGTCRQDIELECCRVQIDCDQRVLIRISKLREDLAWGCPWMRLRLPPDTGTVTLPHYLSGKKD